MYRELKDSTSDLRDVVLLVDGNFRLEEPRDSSRNRASKGSDDYRENIERKNSEAEKIRWTAREYALGVTRKFLVIAELDKYESGFVGKID